MYDVVHKGPVKFSKGIKCSYFTDTAEKFSPEISDVVLVKRPSKNGVRTAVVQEIRVAKLFIAVFGQHT
jgi:hypothetical protein